MRSLAEANVMGKLNLVTGRSPRRAPGAPRERGHGFDWVYVYVYPVASGSKTRASSLDHVWLSCMS